MASAGVQIVIIAAVVAVAIVAAVLAVKFLRHHVFARNFGVVEPARIFRSGRLTPSTLRSVTKRHGIRTVIDLHAFSSDPVGERAIAAEAERLGLDRIVLRGVLGNATGNPNVYVSALRLLRDEDRHPVLIHCAAGAERTGAAVMLYRHIVQGVDIERAYEEAREFGHDPAKNDLLLDYVERHAPAIRSAIESGGAVDGFSPPEVGSPRKD